MLPGVKLNVTRNGLSATVGAAPFSVNVGPRGVYRNINIPGTGVWDRQRIDNPSTTHTSPDFDSAATVPPAAFLPSAPPSPNEICSASTELLTSESLDQLRKLLTDVYHEREVLTKEISAAKVEAKYDHNTIPEMGTWLSPKAAV